MEREGKIVLSKKDIQKTGLSVEEFRQRLESTYKELQERRTELCEVRVYAKRRAIEIVFVGRSVVDSDIILLQDSILPAIIQTLAKSV